MTPLAPHHVPPVAFDAVAAGFGTEAAMDVLVQGQVSRRKALLRALADALEEHSAAAEARDRFTAACSVLTRLETDSAAVVTGRDGVLLHPYFEVWGFDCLSRLVGNGDGEATSPDLCARLSYLTAAAAVAALRAGRPLELDVVLPPRGLPLPGVGRAAPTDDRTGVLRTDGEGLTVVAGGRSLGIDHNRMLAETPRPVRLDDTDPHRNTFGLPVTPRLDDAQAAAWRRTFTQACDLIRADHAAYLPGLDAGLIAVTPLVATDSGADASAAARRAFGAVATVLPPTPARLAVILIHEFQHVKLGALEDLVTLFDESDRTLYYAPWRPDPRPLPNLIQGTYAHLGVTDFWRIHRHNPTADTSLATRQFARWRMQTAQAIESVSGSPALTDDGRRFARAMMTTIGPWLDEPVPAADSSAAERAARQHRERWEAMRKAAGAGL